ncbi:MAG: Stk1 family PASTA domain-containing Ser/Thr kinase [Candidatus Ruminococcus intestinipullorum]|nr:Stk1 family PASTA domain-containing Ser/Thr kinase [Candidatus Ruminococcus intestinipullorum]
MLKEGIFLGQRYEILERIGSGGMADVYKGKDHKLNRFVAIKVLKSDFRSDETFIQKFLSEAQAAAGLMHPNVVNVYDVGQDRGLYYMVMELVEGITLKQYIEKKGRLSAKETVSIAIQMVTGIQAAHNQHIVHRDIKPQNIIISKEGKVKVTDFGIARATTSSHTISTSVMGSVHYTSPEQARGGVVDEKSDIYSAGITMYEMVTGHVPFDGDSTVTVALKHLQEELVSPAREVPEIPKSLEHIILKCTQKSTANRYQSCEEVLLDLKRSLMDPAMNMIGGGTSRPPVSDETVLMDTQELDIIQNQPYQEEYDQDEDYDEEDYDYHERRKSDGKKGSTRDREEVEPQMKKVVKILMIAAILIVVSGAIFGVSRLVIALTRGNPIVEEEQEEQVSVPNILGMTESQAKAELDKYDLGYQKLTSEYSDTYDEGEVMEQDKKAGTKVDKHTTIKIKLSKGAEPKEISVPNVSGKDQTTAENELKSQGFLVDTKFTYDSSVEFGKVIYTDPSAGTVLEEGSTITLYVSQGKEMVVVPDVTNTDTSTAASMMQSASLHLGSEIASEYHDSIEEGKIIRTEPAAGYEAEKGSSVNYVISKGKEIELVDVPSLRGKTQEEAAQELEKVGLKASFITEYSSTITKGYVISWNTNQIEKGGTVQVIISLGIKDETSSNEEETGDSQEEGGEATHSLE